MRKKLLFRAGAIMLAGILTTSEMTAFPVFAQEEGVPETVSWEPGDWQDFSEEGQDLEQNDGSGKGQGEEEGSGVEDFREVLAPASVSGNDVSSGDAGFSGKGKDSDTDEGADAETDEGAEESGVEADEGAEESGAGMEENDAGAEEASAGVEETDAEGTEDIKDIEDSITVSDFSLLGSAATTAYTIGGVEYDISTAEVIDSGTYCGIDWQLYDNGLMYLMGDQTGDISLSNYSRAPWYNKPAVKAVYLNFNTNGHALQRMFWNSVIVGAALGPGFNMTGTSDISSMFSGCSNLTDFDFTGQDFSTVVTMESIFGNCSNITSITFGEGGRHWKP